MAFKGAVSPTLSVEVKTQYTRTVKITSPAEGYRFPVGSNVTIKWTYDGPAELGNIAVNGDYKRELDWTTERSKVIPGKYFPEARNYVITVVGNWGDFNKITITAYTVVVNTILGISVPTSIGAGASFRVKGTLKRTDTGAGLPGQTVDVEQPPGTRIKSGTTDSAGNYSITVTAPTVDGIYKYRTKFTGTSGYGTAVSKTMGIGVGIVNWLDAIRAQWNNLARYQKAIIIATSIGAIIGGASALKKT